MIVSTIFPVDLYFLLFLLSAHYRRNHVSGNNLAGLIEEDNKEEINRVLESILSPYKDKIDSMVLGCTHYSLIKEEIVLPYALISPLLPSFIPPKYRITMAMT